MPVALVMILGELEGSRTIRITTRIDLDTIGRQFDFAKHQKNFVESIVSRHSLLEHREIVIMMALSWHRN